MEVRLEKAELSDLPTLHAMQVTAFQELLEKYQDFDTNPANEDISKIEARFRQDFTCYYFICLGSRKVGAIRIIDKKNAEESKWISPLFILPEFQGRGIAQQAIRLCEEIHGKDGWELATILQERKNCYLYEKMGYVKTDHRVAINKKLTLIYYKKQ